MTKLTRQINPSLQCALISLLLAAPAWGQEQSGEASGEATPEEPLPAAEASAQPTDGTAEATEATDASSPPTDETATEGDIGEGEGDQGEDDEEPPRHFQFGHRHQGGIGFVVGSGYFFEVAYGGSYCYMEGDAEPAVCHGRTPVFFDFQLAFGVTDGLEVMLEYRLGLLQESFGGDEGASITTSRPMAIGVGIRYFVGLPNNRVKAFLGALLDIDFTKNLKVDVFVRPLFGLQIEIVRWMSFFIQASVNLSFVRSFGLAFDGGGGLQFRFP